MIIIKHFIIVICTLALISPLQSQKWKNINDSTYNTIVKQSYNKANILIGFGGTIKVGHGNTSFVSYGIRPQFGYFVFNKWLVFANINYYWGRMTIKDENKKASIDRLFFEANVRYYLKPKARTVFFQLGPFIGTQKSDNGGYTVLETYNEFALGLSGAVGFSVFVQRFKVELLMGLAYSFTETTDYNSFVGANILQLNLSYVFNR